MLLCGVPARAALADENGKQQAILADDSCDYVRPIARQGFDVGKFRSH